MRIEGNTLADNGADLELRAMPRPGHELVGCVVRANRFAGWRGAAVSTSLGSWGQRSAQDRGLTLDSNLFDPPPRKPLYQWGSQELTSLGEVRRVLGLEKAGAVQRLPFSRPLVAARTRERLKGLIIDRAVAGAKVGDEVTVPVNGRTSIQGNRVEVFDLANRYLTLTLPDAEVQRAVETRVPPYPVSEPVFVRVRLDKLTPATDLRGTAQGVTSAARP